MKKIYSLTIAILLSFTSFINADGKNAIMMDKVNDPLLGMVNAMGAKNIEKVRK